jgi:hypothetical protein
VQQYLLTISGGRRESGGGEELLGIAWLVFDCCAMEQIEGILLPCSRRDGLTLGIHVDRRGGREVAVKSCGDAEISSDALVASRSTTRRAKARSFRGFPLPKLVPRLQTLHFFLQIRT